MFFENLADFIMRNAKKIVALWVIALVCCVPFIMQYNSVLAYDMSKMSSSTTMESQVGSEILKSGSFGSGSSMNGGTIILVETYDAQVVQVSESMNDALTNSFYFWDLNEKLRSEYGFGTEVQVNELFAFDDKYFADKDTVMIIYTVSYPELPDGKPLKGSTYIPDVRKMVSDAVAGVDGVVETYVTGTDAISYDTSVGAKQDMSRIDPFSILLILVLIGLFFRSFVSAGTPPIVIGMAYGLLLASVYFIGSFTGIYYITTIIALITMLGAGCDYCIFIISRYREERKDGKDPHAALREAIIWAGESILTSGIAVTIGFGSLAICGFSLVSTMGIVFAVGILLALLAALTFVPALLKIVGDKIFWPATVESYCEGSKAMNGWYGKMSAFGQRYFTHSAQTSIKYAKVIVVVTLLLTVPLSYVALSNSSSYDMISAMPDGEAKDGVAVVSENLGGGLLMPTSITMKVDAFVDVNTNESFTSGDVVPVGTAVRFTAEPYSGYKVVGWIEDGVYHASEATTYETTASGGPLNVTAVYSKVMYSVEFQVSGGHATVSATVNDNNSIVSGETVPYGSKLDIKVIPEPGYRVDSWNISRDGHATVEHIHDTEMEIARASHDYIFTVSIGTDPAVSYNVDYRTDGHGTVAGRFDGEPFVSGDALPERSYIRFSAIPETGYEVDHWEINGVSGFDGETVVEIPSLTTNTTCKAVFKQIPQHYYTVTFTTDGPGAMTATANGTTITSGQSVEQGSKVVFTAAPFEGKQVTKWQYTFNIPGFGPEDVSFSSSKTIHTITYLSSNQTVKVFFGDSIPADVHVNYEPEDPAEGIVTARANGQQISDGATVLEGSSIYFHAIPKDGFMIEKWQIYNTGTGLWNDLAVGNKESISIYSATTDVKVRAVFKTLDSVVVTYGVNDGTMGSMYATSLDMNVNYMERANASDMYAKFNDFANSIMNLETDGKKNVALVVGPMNGDVIFDGEHEWIFDTIANILPQEFKYMLPDNSYDYMTWAWQHVDELIAHYLPAWSGKAYEFKNYLNYWLSYKAGFVSEVFTDVEGGPQYQYVKFMVITKDEPMSALSVDTVKQLFDMKGDFIDENPEVYEGYLSGAAVSNYEVSELVNKDFKMIIFVVIILLMLLLFIVMKSYLTPIRAVATIVMSVLWTLGLTYILFQWILGTPVVWIVPIVLFVICLGLGMDYDILLTTRIKECVIKGMSTDEGIVVAVQKSGAVITLCGLIMAGAFSTMMLSTSPMLKEFGFALGFAIAVDALVIRTYIVPAIMHLMGDWNWKGPNFKWFHSVLYKVKELITDD